MQTEIQVQSGQNVSESHTTSGPNVLLTDTNRWATPARIAIGLAKLGCRVAAVCSTKGHPLLSTTAIERVFPYNSIRPLQSLATAIAESNPQIVIPCDDRGVEHLHELHALARCGGIARSEIAELIEYSLGPARNYSAVTSRWDLLQTAKGEGIRVPDFQLLTNVEELELWKTDHPLPWVLKGDGTFGGRGVRIAQTLESARTYFWELTKMFGIGRAIKRAIVNRDPFWLRPWWNSRRPALIVQSYVRGRAANCAVASWRGEILAGIGVEVVSSEGTTGPASIVRVIENSEMMSAAERIARKLGLSGFFGLDFMIEKGTGAAYLIEMNPRCTPLSHLQLGKGRDLLEALVARLADRPIVERESTIRNELIAYFPQAWLSKSEFFESSFQDIPDGEPALVDSLLRPWPEGSMLYRIAHKLSATSAIGKGQSSSDLEGTRVQE